MFKLSHVSLVSLALPYLMNGGIFHRLHLAHKCKMFRSSGVSQALFRTSQETVCFHYKDKSHECA